MFPHLVTSLACRKMRGIHPICSWRSRRFFARCGRLPQGGVRAAGIEAESTKMAVPAQRICSFPYLSKRNFGPLRAVCISRRYKQRKDLQAIQIHNSMRSFGHVENRLESPGVDSKLQPLEAIQNRPDRIDNAPLPREHQYTQRAHDFEPRRFGVPAGVTVIQHKQMVRRFQPEGQNLLFTVAQARNERQQRTIPNGTHRHP